LSKQQEEYEAAVMLSHTQCDSGIPRFDPVLHTCSKNGHCFQW